ncbi:Hypothetical predicted protein [Mytilus galloprovincialis]|uniref:MACPF domain-containing protein n=1 Tax=Mytilus galloprovincialis TaxID=29158 RepID=A0A8B6H4Q3_MYTGA|nr:Hypothetical predicted protein [Mytilus galloprovincialis]
MTTNKPSTSSAIAIEQTEDTSKIQEIEEHNESMIKDSYSPKKDRPEQIEDGMNVDKIDVPKNDTCSQFSKALLARGLEPSHWEKHFKKHGITNTEQLQHIDQSTINKLSGSTNHSWEKIALNELYNKKDKDNAYRQEALMIMEMLRNNYPDPQKFISDDFKNQADRRKTVFDDNAYKKQYYLDKMNDKLNKETREQQLVVRRPLQNCDVIRKISAGQLLRGQFFHKNLQESSIYRQKLIEIDNFSELLTPGICETMETIEFNDKNQSDEFDSTLKQSGKSLAIALFKGIPFISGGQGHIFGGKTDTDEDKKTSNKQEYFVEISQILNVPTASFTLSHEHVKLSENAMKTLKRLHETFRSKSENDKQESDFEKECKLFFHKYGSHYYTGVCHFGGMYIWKVTSFASSEETCSENYNSAKSALNGSLGGGYIWFGGEIKGSYERNRENAKKKREFSETSIVKKKLEKFGGPQEVDDISLWKKGLAEYNDTWVIIDKDVSQKCYEGVWELIKDDNEFSDAATFSKGIQTIWKSIYDNAEKDAMHWSRSQLYLDWILETSPVKTVAGSKQIESSNQQGMSYKSEIDLALKEKSRKVIEELTVKIADRNEKKEKSESFLTTSDNQSKD